MRAVRRLSTAGLLIAALGVLLLGDSPSVSTAQDDPMPPPEGGFVDVIKVDGLLDPIMVNFIEQSISQAEHDDARWLVLQANSTGSVVSDARARSSCSTRSTSRRCPIAVWVGPSGSQLTNEPARLVGRGRRVRHGAGHRPRQLRPATPTCVDT